MKKPSSSSSSPARILVRALSLLRVATAMTMNNMLLMGYRDLDAFLTELVSFGDLTPVQKGAILDMADDDDGDADAGGDLSHDLHHVEFFASEVSREELRAYLRAEVEAGSIDEDAAESIASSLNLGGLLLPSDNAALLAAEAAMLTNGPVEAVYDSNTQGNMARLGRSNTLRSSDQSGYNGIWGYAAGKREYALQCHGEGFAIVDVTDPSNAIVVQFVAMEGGGYWRDVATHVDASSGKTFAYVGSQGNEGGGNEPNLFVFDLSHLSSTDTPNDTDPIPAGSGWLNLGYTDLTHTINVARGLLFLNSAGNSGGCRVYDLTADPWKPNFLFKTGGKGGHQCHDSYVREGIDGKDVLFVSDGNGRRERFYDITDVNADWERDKLPPYIGETDPISGIYAHESWLSEDNRYLFQFDEDNKEDIIVHDVTSLARPVQIAIMQYSEQGASSKGARPHNGVIKGNYLYAAYYEAGLRVFDVSNPRVPVEVGKVETHRDPDGDGTYNEDIFGLMEGAWNVYPYLPSRNILVSDIANGLFVVRADPPYDAPAAPRRVTARRNKDSNDIVTLKWTAAQNARGYSVERSLDGGNSFVVIAEHLVFPRDLACYVDTDAGGGKAVKYRVSATNGEGVGTSAAVTARRSFFGIDRCGGKFPHHTADRQTPSSSQLRKTNPWD